MEKNTTLLSNDEYYRLKRFYDTISKGEHVVVRSNLYSSDLTIFGNTDKINQLLLDEIDEVREELSECRTRERNINKQNERLRQSLENEYDVRDNLKKKNKSLLIGMVFLSILYILVAIYLF